MPVWTWTFQMLAYAAGSTLDTSQQITYLMFFMAPFLFHYLCQALFPTDPKQRKLAYNMFVRGSQWHWPPLGIRRRSTPKRLKQRRKPRVRFRPIEENRSTALLKAYLLPLAASIFWAGCRVESYIHCRCLREHKSLSCQREPLMALAATSNACTYAHTV